MIKTKPPCSADCQKRSAECHATCEAYLEYEKAHMEEVEREAKRKWAESRTIWRPRRK